MDYKQKYEQALERAKVINPGTADYEAAVKIFPELKESEDERIRKALIHLISEQDGFLTAINGISVKDILAWLEKQSSKDYNPYKATVESISAMVKKYASFDSNLQDFYDNVKIKCKDAAEYDKTWLENQDY